MTKIAIKQESERFRPIELRITLESQQEINALWCIFNHRRLTDLLDFHGFDTGDLHAVLKQYVTDYQDIFEAVKKLIH